MTFETNLRQSHNFLTALSRTYHDIPAPDDLTTQYDQAVDQLCADIQTILGYK